MDMLEVYSFHSKNPTVSIYQNRKMTVAEIRHYNDWPNTTGKSIFRCQCVFWTLIDS